MEKKYKLFIAAISLPLFIFCVYLYIDDGDLTAFLFRVAMLFLLVVLGGIIHFKDEPP